MQGHFPLGPRAPGGTAAHAAAGRTQRSERRVQCFACSSRRPPVRAGLAGVRGRVGERGDFNYLPLLYLTINQIPFLRLYLRIYH
jgi:hypothetical protein